MRSPGPTTGGAATLEGGRGVVQRVMTAWGTAPGTLVQADGSGLSRYNYVTAGTLASILVHMYADARHRDPWLSSLAVGGVDGTLEKRFRGTSVDGRLRAKTGTLAVRARALGVRAFGRRGAAARSS